MSIMIDLDLLQKARIEQGLNYKELSDRSTVSYDIVRGLLTKRAGWKGTRNPDNIKKIAGALNVKMKDVVKIT